MKKTPIHQPAKKLSQLRQISRQILQPPVLAVIILLLLGQFWLISYSKKTSTSPMNTSDVSRATHNDDEVGSAPKFETILPGDKTIDDLGGWTRVSPKDSTEAYAYRDKLGDASIVVTEQQLPEHFEEDIPANIQDLAKVYGATQRIPASSAEAYITTPRKGPQYVIATKYRLLILIKSDEVLSTDQWTSYVSSMR